MTPEIKVRAPMPICTTLNLLNLCRLVEKFRLFHAMTNFSNKKINKKMYSLQIVLSSQIVLSNVHVSMISGVLRYSLKIRSKISGP
eukprot:SAG11_NODE_127_length_15677_cov_10.890872_12_plen_86_part_00